MDIVLSLFTPLLLAYLMFRVWPLSKRSATPSIHVQAILDVLPAYSSTPTNQPVALTPIHSLPRAHQRLLRAVGYDRKMARAKDAEAANRHVLGWVGDVVRKQLQCSNPSPMFSLSTRAPADPVRIRESMRHLLRDWSLEGASERQPVFDLIIEALHRHSPAQSSVLIPGAGLCRLAYQVASTSNKYNVTAIEMSPYMNIVRRVILPTEVHSNSEGLEPNSQTIYPFASWWSHTRSADNLFRPVAFPDVVPRRQDLANLRILEGDFLKDSTFGYDTIITLFFIDALPNPIRTISHIYALLRPGGVWINLGPLLYGSGGGEKVELTLDEVIGVAQGMGFRFVDVGLGKSTTVECEYTRDERAMMQWVYRAEMWVAIK